MKTYIALLRGINVGGHKKIKMADLRTALEDVGFQSVQTYIQSGNIVFMSEATAEACTTKIAATIEKVFGFIVPTLVLTDTYIKGILAKNPFSEEKIKDCYYTILSHFPEKDEIKDFEAVNYPDEEMILLERCVYYYTSKGFRKSKYSNNLAEKKLKVQATTRNHRTMSKLVEMAQSLD